MDKIWKTWYQSDQGVTMCGFTSTCICICNCILPECIAGEEKRYWYQGDQGVDQLGCHHRQLGLECRGVKDLICRNQSNAFGIDYSLENPSVCLYSYLQLYL